MFRLKEILKNGKTTYVVQQRTLRFFWWNMSEPIEDKILAEGLRIILSYKYNGKL